MTGPEGDRDGYSGFLDPELLVGLVVSVSASRVGVGFARAGESGGVHYLGHRYGRGEVGEFVVIETQTNVLLGRILEIRLSERKRASNGFVKREGDSLDVVGSVQLLGSASMERLEVVAGVGSYPRIGDRVYAAPHRFIADIPTLMEGGIGTVQGVHLDVGRVGTDAGGVVSIRPEVLFGRHCAVLGATGGGKSWTVARLVEECQRFSSKTILLDATGEYRSLLGSHVDHCHFGVPVDRAIGSVAISVPPACFIESDFVAMFEPAGKVQAPKLREAIRSLRLAKIRPRLATNGVVRKINQSKQGFLEAVEDGWVASQLDNPTTAFDVRKLPAQIEQECVYPAPYGVEGDAKWGGPTNEFANCLPLVSRIEGVLVSPAFECVFGSPKESLTERIDGFLAGDQKVMRVCMSGIAHEFRAREVVANVVGRHMLTLARKGEFRGRPTLLVVDEAHNFVGSRLGSEESVAKLDAFEVIAKEGRKYGLCMCLATQRPRDLTPGVLSQMGTLVVHRLTNDRDREVVERACGEIDRTVVAFLPNLKPGEAVFVGIDFPIPLTIKVEAPEGKPESDGPNFSKHWSVKGIGKPVVSRGTP